MIYSNLHGLVFHVSCKDPCLVLTPGFFTHAEVRLWRLLWSSLVSDRRSCIVGLVKLPSIFVTGVPRTLGDGPMGQVLLLTRVRAVLRVVGTRADDFWSRNEQNKRVKTLDSSPSIKTELRRSHGFWLDCGIILWARSHLILLLVDWKPWGSSKPGISNIISANFIGFIDIELSETRSTSISFRK